MSNAIWRKDGPRLALVTGASAGLGEAFARLLAEEGWQLALADDNEEELHRVAGVVHAEHAVETHVIVADLSTPEGVDHLVQMMMVRNLAPDLLVHATIPKLEGRALDIPRERQLRHIDLTVRAAADLSLRLLPHMRAQKAGGVLLVTSPGAFLPGLGRAVQHANGAWMLSFGEALADELRGEGVGVSVLCEGPIGITGKERKVAPVLTRLLPSRRAEVVARAALQGFKEGRVVIVPGVLNRLLLFFSRMLPRFMVRRLAGAFWRI